MEAFWEKKFKSEKAVWGMYPSNSALKALEIFQLKKAKTLLIPGSGYGRNAKLFIDNNFEVTGIEISQTAINLAKNTHHIKGTFYKGSVNNMPYDNKLYDGIFCYALIHLLNKTERKLLIKNCFSQLKPNGIMLFTVISKHTSLFKAGKKISENRCKLSSGLKVFFYDTKSIQEEFGTFGFIESIEIDEPIKYMKNEPPIKCIFIKCCKQ